MKRTLALIAAVGMIVTTSAVAVKASGVRFRPDVDGSYLCLSDGSSFHQTVVWDVSNFPGAKYKMHIISRSAANVQTFPFDQRGVVKNHVVAFWKWKTVVNGHIVKHRKQGESVAVVRLPGDCAADTADNLITYSVDGSGTVDVNYDLANGSSSATVQLPWSIQVPILEANQFFYLSAYAGAAPSGMVCNIRWGSQTLATAPGSGAFASCSVDARLPN